MSTNYSNYELGRTNSQESTPDAGLTSQLNTNSRREQVRFALHRWAFIGLAAIGMAENAPLVSAQQPRSTKISLAATAGALPKLDTTEFELTFSSELEEYHNGRIGGFEMADRILKKAQDESLTPQFRAVCNAQALVIAKNARNWPQAMEALRNLAGLMEKDGKPVEKLETLSAYASAIVADATQSKNMADAFRTIETQRDIERLNISETLIIKQKLDVLSINFDETFKNGDRVQASTILGMVLALAEEAMDVADAETRLAAPHVADPVLSVGDSTSASTCLDKAYAMLRKLPYNKEVDVRYKQLRSILSARRTLAATGSSAISRNSANKTMGEYFVLDRKQVMRGMWHYSAAGDATLAPLALPSNHTAFEAWTRAEATWQLWVSLKDNNKMEQSRKDILKQYALWCYQQAINEHGKSNGTLSPQNLKLAEDRIATDAALLAKFPVQVTGTMPIATKKIVAPQVQAEGIVKPAAGTLRTVQDGTYLETGCTWSAPHTLNIEATIYSPDQSDALLVAFGGYSHIKVMNKKIRITLSGAQPPLTQLTSTKEIGSTPMRVTVTIDPKNAKLRLFIDGSLDAECPIQGIPLKSQSITLLGKRNDTSKNTIEICSLRMSIGQPTDNSATSADPQSLDPKDRSASIILSPENPTGRTVAQPLGIRVQGRSEWRK